MFTKSELHVVAGPKKTDILAQLSDACAAAGITLQLHPKPKKEDGAPQIEALLFAIKATADTPTVGTLPKVCGGGHCCLVSGRAFDRSRCQQCVRAEPCTPHDV